MDFQVKFMSEYQRDVEYSTSEWLRVTRHVLGELEEFLGLPIRIPSNLEDQVGDRICFEISSPHPFAGGLELSWRGLFFVVIVENIRPIEFGVTLFLYSRGGKLNRYKEDSHLGIVYAIEAGEGKWFVENWFHDEHDEFPEFASAAQSQ